MFLASNGVFVLVTLNPNVLIFCLLKFSTVATATLSCSLSNDFNVSNNSNILTLSNFACCKRIAPVDCAAGLSKPFDSKKPITASTSLLGYANCF